jgi:GNAT superfamily N-acetyltransferase
VTSTPHQIAVRPVRPSDVPAMVAMAHDLAGYERASSECHLTQAQLSEALFCPIPALFGLVAHDGGDVVGMALWFRNFSTWEGVHGVYLEDLYVAPAARGRGAGQALLAGLADICVRNGYRRLEWWVLHWNPAREFYHSIGAVAMDEWVPYRLSGEALARLAACAGAPSSQGGRRGAEMLTRP